MCFSFDAGFQREAFPLAGCKGSALRQIDRKEQIIRRMICDLNDRAVGSGVQRVKPLLGDPRGQSPSGKFRMLSVDGIRCEVACHFAKLA